MAEPWKWGFTPGERKALLFICAAILADLCFRVGQRQAIPSVAPLTHSDSLSLAALRTATETVTSPAQIEAETLPNGPLDLNQASREQIEALPGIGPVLAQRILAWRDSLGGFKTADDLGVVPGIGSKRLAKLRPLIALSPP